MDTKYKRHTRPDESDIQQVVAYAVKMETDKAFLVYPTTEIEPIDVPVGDKRVRSLAFDVSEDPDRAGKRFLAELAERLS